MQNKFIPLWEQFENKNEFNNTEGLKNDLRRPEAGRLYSHNFQPGIKIQLVSETATGWKVTQFDSFTPGGSKRRAAKRKQAFYSSSELSDLFTIV